MITTIIPYAAGVLAFAAIAFLLYIVVCQIFLGHDGHIDRIFGRAQNRKIKKTLFPWLLPVALSVGLFVLYWVVSSFYRNSLLQVSGMGLYSLLPVKPTFSDFKTLFLCLMSMLFYLGGSLMAWQLGGDKWCVLFCLNPLAVFLVLPGQYSLVALLLTLGYWGVRHKKYLVTGLCVAVYLGLHVPFTGVDWGELIILAYVMLVPCLARFNKRKFSLITGVLATICGLVPVVQLCIIQIL